MADILNSIIHSSDNAVNGLYNAMSIRRQKEHDTQAAARNAYTMQRGQAEDKHAIFERAAQIVGGRPENIQLGLDYLAMNGPPPNDPRVGEMLVAYGQTAQASGNDVFQPQRIINADGSESLVLPSKNGSAVPVALPPNSRLAPQVTYFNAGNMGVPVTRSGVDPGLPAIPISPRPQDMPEFQYDVTAAREQAATDAIAPRSVVQAPADASVAGAVEKARTAAQKEQEMVFDKKAKFPKVKAMVQSEERQNKFINDTIDDALTLADKAGGYGDYLSWVNSSDYKTLSSLLNTIKANISFGKLQEMRNNSPTGGALGNVSDNENKKLEAVAGSLEQGLEPAILKRNLNRLKEMRGETFADLQSAFGEDFADFITPEAPQPAPQGRNFEAEYNVR